MKKEFYVTVQEKEAIKAYIKRGWTVLRRSNNDLNTAETDLKFSGSSLLYLPHPYIVPGGRFNEMYGWDSYFIIIGLLRDGEIELAKNMVDNFVFEIEKYGKILNANRSYYLTRSQPPIFTQSVLAVFEKTKDKVWLETIFNTARKYYEFWISEPHVVKDMGLSRYFDIGSGPALEVIEGERDSNGRTHYERICDVLKNIKETEFRNIKKYYNSEKNILTEEGYKGDRSMRESGFDPSNRFGLFNLEITEYAPTCLNSLLYQTEIDIAEICYILGLPDIKIWKERAEKRKKTINSLLWDEESGLYFDYNFESKKLRKYPFLTTFYPLWTGIASKEQAAKVAGNLGLFEEKGGLKTGTSVTGNQWDAPFGWAPLHMIAIWGLIRYGYKEEAKRISAKFLQTIFDNFYGTNTIVEKYDVVTGKSDVSKDIKFGYSSNEIGFGWTNAAVLELLALFGNKDKK